VLPTTTRLYFKEADMSEKIDLIRKLVRKQFKEFENDEDAYGTGSRDAYRCVLEMIRNVEREVVTSLDDY
jgi:hypothetical protein